MAVPIITALKMWAGTLFTKDDWDFNFSQIVSWLADGNADLVVNTIKTTNGIDLDGAQISNLGAATTGSQAITLDQANTILNRSSYYYPFSVASGKVDANGDAAYLQKDSDTQVTVLAGNTNPDLVCIMSDGTIESVTSNTVLTVQVNNGTYHIVKEKEQAISITAGASNVITVGKAYPSTPNIGDYFCDNSVTPFKGYKYTSNGWEECAFCWLGDVTVSSGVATIKQFPYNDNYFDVNLYVLSRLILMSGTTSGYLKIVNPVNKSKGVMIAWGYKSSVSSGDNSVTFPVSFPSGILPRVVTQNLLNYNGSLYQPLINSITNAGFVFYTPHTNSHTVLYIAAAGY